MSVRVLEAARRVLERAVEDCEARLIRRVKTEDEPKKRLQILSEMDALVLLRGAIHKRIQGEIEDAE